MLMSDSDWNLFWVSTGIALKFDKFDGTSKVGANVRCNLCYLICLRHLMRARVVTNQTFSPNKPTFLHAFSTCSDLPYDISTMVIMIFAICKFRDFWQNITDILCTGRSAPWWTRTATGSCTWCVARPQTRQDVDISQEFILYVQEVVTLQKKFNIFEWENEVYAIF